MWFDLGNSAKVMGALAAVLCFQLPATARASVWMERLTGRWQGHFADCIRSLGPLHQFFETDAQMDQKLQGVGLQGLIDLGAHGWAFSSQADDMPDGTMKLTLYRYDAAGLRTEYRLEATPEETQINFRTPGSRPDIKITLGFSLVNEDPNQLNMVLDHVETSKLEIISCSGTLNKGKDLGKRR
jgi:hypothetical protein